MIFLRKRGYSQTFVDTQGTAHGTFTLSDAAQFEFACSVEPKTVTQGDRIMNLSTDSAFQGIQGTGGSAGGWRIRFFDSASTEVFNIRYGPGIFAADTLVHLYIAIELTTPTITVLVNGSTPSVDITTTSLIAGNGTLHLDDIDIFSNAGSNILDAHVSDLFVNTGTAHGYSALYTASNKPKDRSALSADIYMGAGMGADARNGNTAEGWNDGFNIAGTSITVGSATFADV